MHYHPHSYCHTPEKTVAVYMTQNGNRSTSHSTFAFIFLKIFLVLNSSILFLRIQAIQVSCFLVPFFDPWPLTSLTSCPHVDVL
jgi:hypothetical protein